MTMSDKNTDKNTGSCRVIEVN